MKVYYLGKEEKGESMEFIKYYFAIKRNGFLLIRKINNNAREVFDLIPDTVKKIVYLGEQKFHTEVKLGKDVIDNIISLPTLDKILTYVGHKFIFKTSETTPMKAEFTTSKESNKLTYTTKTGAIITGTIQEITTYCNAMKETLDLSQLDYDKTKFHYSDKKGLMKLSDMNTVHLMNATAKRIRDYFEELVIPKTSTINEFYNSLEAWTKNPEICAFIDELNKRV